jgi:hypothetical protein
MQGVYGVQGTGVVHEDTTEVGYQVGIPGGIPAKISGIVLSSLSPPPPLPSCLHGSGLVSRKGCVGSIYGI